MVHDFLSKPVICKQRFDTVLLSLLFYSSIVWLYSITIKDIFQLTREESYYLDYCVGHHHQGDDGDDGESDDDEYYEEMDSWTVGTTCGLLGNFYFVQDHFPVIFEMAGL